MPLAITRFTPTDYDHWYRVHVESVRRFREELTLISDVIYRDCNDPRAVVVIFEVQSAEKFQAFLASPTFSDLVAEAKLEGDSTFWVIDKVEEVRLDAD